MPAISIRPRFLIPTALLALGLLAECTSSDDAPPDAEGGAAGEGGSGADGGDGSGASGEGGMGGSGDAGDGGDGGAGNAGEGGAPNVGGAAGAGGVSPGGAGGQPPTCGSEGIAAKPCSAGCSEEELCIREVCIAHCGADLSAVEAALGESFVPIAGFCAGRDRTVYPYVTEEDGCERFRYYGLNTSGEQGSNVINWVVGLHEVTSLQLNIATVQPGFGSAFPPWDSLSFFQSGALSPDGSRIAFSMHDGAFTRGKLFSLATSNPVWTNGPEIVARGVDFLDGETLLVAAGDVVGVPANFSEASAPKILVTGVPNGAEGVHVLRQLGFVLLRDVSIVDTSDLYIVPVESIEAALTGTEPLDVTSAPEVRSVTGREWSSLLGNDYLVQWNDENLASDRVIQRLTVEAGELTLGPAVSFAAGGIFEQLIYLNEGRVLVRYRQGGIYGTLH